MKRCLLIGFEVALLSKESVNVRVFNQADFLFKIMKKLAEIKR